MSASRPLNSVPLPTLLAIGAVIVVVVLSVSLGRPIVAAVLVPAAHDVAVLEGANARDAFDREMTRSRRQIVGRSMFFRPLPPPPAPTVVVEEEEEPDPGPPPKPTRYGGPAIMGMIDGHVWFKDGQVLVVGGEASRGLRVVDWNPPWTARVEWEEVEFDVELFRRTTESYLDPIVPEPANETPAPAEDAAPEDEESETNDG